MMAKHPVGPDLPVECAYFMMSTFQALQWWALFPVYAYAEWFEQQDTRAAYAVFRAHLQLVQRLGSHWVLKSPGHFLRLDELLETLPEARVVPLHRDPVEVLASTRRVSSHWGRFAQGPRPGDLGTMSPFSTASRQFSGVSS